MKSVCVCFLRGSIHNNSEQQQQQLLQQQTQPRFILPQTTTALMVFLFLNNHNLLCIHTVDGPHHKIHVPWNGRLSILCVFRLSTSLTPLKSLHNSPTTSTYYTVLCYYAAVCVNQMSGVDCTQRKSREHFQCLYQTAKRNKDCAKTIV